jgi:hypothetical protein
MTHLTREELVAWRDRHAETERERVMAHLGSCHPCASAYAELVRTAPAGEPAHFNPADFVERGYAVRTSAASGWLPSFSSWRAWGGALSAAAALVLVVALGTELGRHPGEGLRGSTLELTAPSVIVTRPVLLEWTTSLAAARFAVEIKDAGGAVVYRGESREKSLRLPDSAVGALRLGQTYTWTVTALDADGQPVTSASGTFVAAAAP